MTGKIKILAALGSKRTYAKWTLTVVLALPILLYAPKPGVAEHFMSPRPGGAFDGLKAESLRFHSVSIADTKPVGDSNHEDCLSGFGGDIISRARKPFLRSLTGINDELGSLGTTLPRVVIKGICYFPDGGDAAHPFKFRTQIDVNSRRFAKVLKIKPPIQVRGYVSLTEFTLSSPVKMKPRPILGSENVVRFYGRSRDRSRFSQIEVDQHYAKAGQADTWNPYKSRQNDHPKGPVSHLLLGVQILLFTLSIPAACYVIIKAATEFFNGGHIATALLKVLFASGLVFGSGVIMISGLINT